MKTSHPNRIEPDDPVWQQALDLHQRAVVIDTHSDVPFKIVEKNIDIGKHRTDGHEDIPRMLAGGLDCQFMAIFVSNDYEGNGALRRAITMTERLQQQMDRYADKVVLVKTPIDVQRAKNEGKLAIALALEGGHALENSLDILHYLHRVGMQYVTLTHIDANDLADSSTDIPKWHGLSDFGKEVVQEMNRLGMMVDVSHISDQAFWDVLKISTKPVIATHSSCRALANLPRNISDEMINGLAEKGGVVQVCFGSAFIHPQWAERGSEILKIIREKHNDNPGHWFVLWDELNAKRPLPEPTIDDLIDHIDHIAELVGVEHVGLGSDYDGVAHVPKGVDDVSFLPNITYKLLKRNYSEADILKILGGNMMRVWQTVVQT